MHLFAISGLHIGVIAACGHRLPRIPIPNIVLIGLFVMMTEKLHPLSERF